MTDPNLFNMATGNHAPLILAAVFRTFDAQHKVMLGVIAALCIFTYLGAKGATPANRRRFGRLLGMILLSYAVCMYTQQGMAHALSWEYSLPLDLCNLVLFASVLSLFKPWQFTSEIAYFWGFGGVLQATLTPDLAAGFPSWDFTLFFWGHGATLLAIVFLISDREFKPGRSSIGRMLISLNLYGLVVGTINAIGGWNYGYLCRKPSMPSLLDLLGPWPWYLLSLEFIALLMFAVLYLLQRLLAGFREFREDGVKGWSP
jgi:hypothetical integral membrane protein (TIGR02206 family)